MITGKLPAGVKGRLKGSLLLFLTVILPLLYPDKSGFAEGQGWVGINLGSAVNSPYNDFGPIISADGKYLLFTSDRPGGMGGQDFWMSERVGGEWQQAVNMGPTLNTNQNEGPDTFSVDRLTLYFTGCDRSDGNCEEAGCGGSQKCKNYYKTNYQTNQLDASRQTTQQESRVQDSAD